MNSTFKKNASENRKNLRANTEVMKESPAGGPTMLSHIQINGVYLMHKIYNQIWGNRRCEISKAHIELFLPLNLRNKTMNLSLLLIFKKALKTYMRGEDLAL